MAPSSAHVGRAALRHEQAGIQGGTPVRRLDGPASAMDLVSSELAAVNVRLQELVQSDVASIPQVAKHLLNAGGKRLRPALTALGARAAGNPECPVDLLCVGELIHLGSLLHDDVVDDAPARRGRTTAHLLHGNPMSVLAGDFCLARAVWLAAESGGAAAAAALGEAVTEMAEGEVLQLRAAGDLGTTVDQYLRVVERKSAALLGWCASAGAWACGQRESAQRLTAFGRAAGVAFQITDDVLDYSEGTGKVPGADLRQRKVTLPLLIAMEQIPGLREDLEGRATADGALTDLLLQIRSSGALDLALSQARERARQAVAILEDMPSNEGRMALEQLAMFLVDRAS